MSQKENFGTFVEENVKIAREYFEARFEIYRLKTIRVVSKLAGHFIWLAITLFLLFLILIFIGLVLGFWFSDITGSHVKGFGLATLSLLFIMMLLALFRKQLFINPMIKTFLNKTKSDQ